jgi:hypothetical protein
MKWPPDFVKTFARRLGTLSMSCKEAARLQSAALDRKLTPLEMFGLRCHLFLCKWCARYGRQIRFLRAAAHDQGQDDRLAPPPGLSLEARTRIKRSLHSGQK